MPQPTIGRTVLYQLSAGDAQTIAHRRGQEGVTGNVAVAGQIYPAVVVRTFGGDQCNLQVLLDGPDTFWATSRKEGDEPGAWTWPERV